MSKNTDRIIRIILSPGDKIRYKSQLYDEWKIVEVISKAGKSTGQFKNSYNVKHNDHTYFLNLDNLVRFERQINGDNDENNNLEFDLRQKWSTLGSPIAYGGISKIYEYYNKKISKKEIERILSTIPSYTKFKQRKSLIYITPFLFTTVINSGR